MRRQSTLRSSPVVRSTRRTLATSCGSEWERTRTADAKTLRRFLAFCNRQPSEIVSGSVKYLHRNDRLLIDCDRLVPSLVMLWKRLRELKITPTQVSYERSFHARHWHITVGLPFRLPDLGIFFCQLYCGSDPIRERWNFLRSTLYRDRTSTVQVLFDRKETLK